MASIEMHSSDMGLRTTEVAGGYIVSETGEIAPARAMGRLLGFSFIVAGLGLLVVPVGAGLTAKLVLAIGMIVLGGIFAARAGQAPRMELVVDLEKHCLRKRRVLGEGQSELVAQWRFDTISGLNVEGETGRGALFVEAGPRRLALLRGAPSALRDAARRIGADLVRARKAG